mmetsp:Transcript_51183/g.163850  ORF Transcript_51183/g.163850 Transcript_51183/m.163850 type:complete len:92 (+) Transcript_51183:2-277(+)
MRWRTRPRALGQLGEYGRCFAGALAAGLRDEACAEVRREALLALGRMGACGAAFADEAAEFLHDEAPAVRAAAAEALELMASRGAPAALAA